MDEANELTYLASPYNHALPEIREWRYQQAIKATIWLMNDGRITYSPIVHNHPLAQSGQLETGWDFWQRFDSTMLNRCNEVAVLTIPGWKESQGIKAELEIAHTLNLPILYLCMTPRGDFLWGKHNV